MGVDDPIIGLSLDGDDRAYGVALLSRHEVVNDVVGGQPIVVTWCPLCYTALAFDRKVEHDGSIRSLTFGVSGRLLANALVMYDRETQSLWSQPLGRSIDGEFRGTTLHPLAAALSRARSNMGPGGWGTAVIPSGASSGPPIFDTTSSGAADSLRGAADRDG